MPIRFISLILTSDVVVRGKHFQRTLNLKCDNLDLNLNSSTWKWGSYSVILSVKL